MKNRQGENYEFVEVTPNHWQLQGQPVLSTVVKGGKLVTNDTTNCQVVNYSGQLSIGLGSTIGGRRITQINFVNGVPEYVTM